MLLCKLSELSKWLLFDEKIYVKHLNYLLVGQFHKSNLIVLSSFKMLCNLDLYF